MPNIYFQSRKDIKTVNKKYYADQMIYCVMCAWLGHLLKFSPTEYLSFPRNHKMKFQFIN